MASNYHDARPTPLRIVQYAMGYQPLYALACALDLRLFYHLKETGMTRAELEAAIGASGRGLGMLLNVMVSLGCLTRTGTNGNVNYELTPESETFLVEGCTSYLGGYIQYLAYQTVGYWQRLTECVKSGLPVESLRGSDVSYWDDMVGLLFPWNYPAATALGKELHDIYSGKELRVLDIAAGSGVWGIAVAQTNKATQVVACDRAAVLAHARRNAERLGVEAQFEFRTGDIRKDQLGQAEYDAAILGHICHSEGAENSRSLFTKVQRALKPGGTIVIADLLVNEDRCGPMFTLLYALNMLITTTEGDTFTHSEYNLWLEESGFETMRLLEAGGQSLILARRPG